jgi:hypothetical protein
MHLVLRNADSTFKDLEFALKARLQPFVIADPEMGSEYLSQPKDIQMKKVPEYFSRFRDNWDRLSAYLGACIVAKVRFDRGRLQNSWLIAQRTAHIQ